MRIQAVFFDFGGVILRTEYQAPREHLAERLGLSYEELVTLVFDSESARRATLGELSPQLHWESVANRVRRAATDVPVLHDEFFGGDVLDTELMKLIRSLRPARQTGLISNAWLDLREYLRRNRIEDAFDSIIISAEVGLAKPDPAIFAMALDAVGVQPAQSVMVDDSPENIEAARALGMHGILFRDPRAALEDLRRVLA